MSKIGRWSTTAANNNSASPDGFPENMAPSGVNNSEREVMAQVKTWHDDAEWRDLNENYTVAYASATTFTIAGVDLTSLYPANRRVKCVDATDLYGYVSSSAFATNTTVTVVLDSGSLSASLTEVFVGIDPTNKSLPQSVPYKDVAETVTGNWIYSGTPRFNDTVTFNSDPSGWGGGYKALQFGYAGAIMYGISVPATRYMNNGYYNGTDFIYETTNPFSEIQQNTTGDILFLDAPSGTAETVMTRTERAKMHNGGGLTLGSGLSSQGAGTINVQNGIYGAGVERATKAVILDEPELITSSPVANVWTTVNNATLNTAGAITAILKTQVTSTASTAATTDSSIAEMRFRKTGTTPTYTRVAHAVSATSVVGESNPAAADAEAHVNLDASFDFDYYFTSTGSGTPTNTGAIYLVGYIIEI